MINNNTMRVSGLASGMNTDEIVDNLVKAQSSRLYKMQQTKILTNWKSDSYRDVNKKLDEFRKAMEGLRLQSTFNKQAVSSSDSRIEVASGGISTQTEFVISEATLPTTARPAIVSFDSKMASGSTLIGGAGSTDVTFSLNGQSITLTPGMTFDQAIAKINESSALTNVKAANVGGSLVFTSTGTGDTQKVEFTGLTGSNNLGLGNTLVSGTVSFDSKMASGSTVIGGPDSTDVTFTLNGQSITLTPDMTFDQAIAKINESSTLTNVEASNDGGSLVFTSTETGDTNKIEITGLTGSNNLGLGNKLANGTNASSGTVTINNTQIHVSSNKFTYEGVTFNLKGDVLPGANISVRVGTDTQGIFDNIKTFVDKYNDLIADFNGKLNEKRYRDYPPLLEDQKKDMKENDIKLWDEKAKSGLLTNDSTIRSFLTEMRNSLNTVIENVGVSPIFKSLKDIGINFSSNYQDNGKLILDESKLKGVLQTNSEDIKQLFTIKDTGAPITSTTVTDSNMHKKSGFGWRMYDRLNVAISQLGSIAGSPNTAVDTKSTIAQQLKSLDSNIYREQDKISAYEERMWKQFTAMEKALQQLNSQGSWLSQQLGL
jgi:flagellar hook-associated protein 2